MGLRYLILASKTDSARAGPAVWGSLMIIFLAVSIPMSREQS